MNSLREAALEMLRAWNRSSLCEMILAVHKINDALAEPEEDGWRRCAVGQGQTQHCALLESAVLAEREACAEVLVVKIKRHEQFAEEAALRGEYGEVTVLRSTARKLSECVAEIRARGNT